MDEYDNGFLSNRSPQRSQASKFSSMNKNKKERVKVI